MQFHTPQLLAVLALAASTSAHFVLQIPTSLGFDDTIESTGPCGGFTATDRSTGVTSWPVGGSSISVLTTHTTATFSIKAALLSNPTNFVPLVNDISQKGVGTVCFPSIPGNSAWAGQDAVLQIIQNGADGILYQCAAIKFAAGGPASVPSGCTNSTGVSAFYLESGGPPPPSSSAAPTSSAVSSTSSTPAAPSSTTSSAPVIASAASSSAAPSSLTSVLLTSAGSKPTTALSGSGSSAGSSSSASKASSTDSGSSAAAATSKASATGAASGNSTTTANPAQFTGAGSLVSVGNFLFMSGASFVAFMLL